MHDFAAWIEITDVSFCWVRTFAFLMRSSVLALFSPRFLSFFAILVRGAVDERRSPVHFPSLSLSHPITIHTGRTSPFDPPRSLSSPSCQQPASPPAARRSLTPPPRWFTPTGLPSLSPPPPPRLAVFARQTER